MYVPRSLVIARYARDVLPLVQRQESRLQGTGYEDAQVDTALRHLSWCKYLAGLEATEQILPEVAEDLREHPPGFITGIIYTTSSGR